jgi:hypothetical protein
MTIVMSTPVLSQKPFGENRTAPHQLEWRLDRAKWYRTKQQNLAWRQPPHPVHLTVEACTPRDLRLDAVRYRREFRIRQLAEVFAVGLIVSLIYPTRSWLTCLKCGLVYALVWYLFYFFRYWESRPDYVIQRFFVRRIVFPFPNITYVGPMGGVQLQILRENHPYRNCGRQAYVRSACGPGSLSD